MDEAVLDPELEPLAGNAPVLQLTLDSIAVIREQGSLAAPVELSDAVERTDHVVQDDPRVVVRVHRARGTEGTLPCVYSIHGGGYVFGSYEMDDLRFDRWCVKHNCVGVSVEYRLAPDAAYPGPLEDCYAGLKWVHDHADAIGIDRSRIGISGVSAGGGLAAALALLARDRGEVPIAFQLLECPMIDDRQTSSSSRRDGMLIWSRESNEFGWRCYLGELYGSDDIPPYAAAARATDLRGLPPALVIVGGADGFRDEDIEYALRLGQAGVPPELHVLPGAPHGVQMFAGTRIAQRWADYVDDWLARMLAG
jgi:acetyl esterase/lipase